MNKIIDNLKAAIHYRDESIKASYKEELSAHIRPSRMIEIQNSFLEDPIKKALQEQLIEVLSMVVSPPVTVSKEMFERAIG